MNISKAAQQVIETISRCKGQFVNIQFKTSVKPAASNKHVTITKFVDGVFRTGINFANTKAVKEEIEKGEREEVKPLAWGEWAAFPWIIAHKGEEYIRLYPVESQVPSVRFLVEIDSVPVPQPAGVQTNEWVASYLTPADKAKLLSHDKEVPECINKKLSDIKVVGCWTNGEDEVVEDHPSGLSGEHDVVLDAISEAVFGA